MVCVTKGDPAAAVGAAVVRDGAAKCQVHFHTEVALAVQAHRFVMPPVLHMDAWYVSACFVAIGLPTVRIWDRANAGCHSWNPLTCLLSRFVPLTEG